MKNNLFVPLSLKLKDQSNTLSRHLVHKKCITALVYSEQLKFNKDTPGAAFVKFCTVKHNFNHWFTKAILTCRKDLFFNTEMPYTDKKTASACWISAMM